MRDYELIEKLCEVTTMLSDIVREQAAVIEQADIPDFTKETLEQKRGMAEIELGSIVD